MASLLLRNYPFSGSLILPPEDHDRRWATPSSRVPDLKRRLNSCLPCGSASDRVREPLVREELLGPAKVAEHQKEHAGGVPVPDAGPVKSQASRDPLRPVSTKQNADITGPGAGAARAIFAARRSAT